MSCSSKSADYLSFNWNLRAQKFQFKTFNRFFPLLKSVKTADRLARPPKTALNKATSMIKVLSRKFVKQTIKIHQNPLKIETRTAAEYKIRVKTPLPSTSSAQTNTKRTPKSKFQFHWIQLYINSLMKNLWTLNKWIESLTRLP